MNAHFITRLWKRLTPLFRKNRSVFPPENLSSELVSPEERLEEHGSSDCSPSQHIEERPEFILRNPGPSVYLYKADAYYKIGRTKNLIKRDKQIKLQLPFRAVPIYVIYTDDEVWLEKYWHTEFAAKRRNGEWFELNEADVQRFCERDEIPKPVDAVQAQLEFPHNHPQHLSRPTEDNAPTAGQIDPKATLVREVESYYLHLISLHPESTRALEGSRNYQLGCIDSEVNRLLSRPDKRYDQIAALKEWRRKAIMAAEAQVRHSG